jgi:adenylate cyclase class IV
MRSIDLRAELRDPDLARAVCARAGGVCVVTLQQRDTYFRVPSGRLKRRESDEEEPEWIFSSRDDLLGPALCQFRVYSEEEARAHFGLAPLPVWMIVNMKRELWMTGGVRIALDDVEEVGRFLKLEAFITRRSPESACRRHVAKMLDDLRPALGELIAADYADLLAAETRA